MAACAVAEHLPLLFFDTVFHLAALAIYVFIKILRRAFHISNNVTRVVALFGVFNS